MFSYHLLNLAGARTQNASRKRTGGRKHVLRWMRHRSTTGTRILQQVRETDTGNDCAASFAGKSAAARSPARNSVACVFRVQYLGWTGAAGFGQRALSASARDERCAAGCSQRLPDGAVYNARIDHLSQSSIRILDWLGLAAA